MSPKDMGDAANKQRSGIQKERLVGDGQTFTILMKQPRSITPSPQIYRMQQQFIGVNQITTSTTIESTNSFIFQLNEITQSSALTSIFDQYRIAAVEFWLVPNFSAASNSNNGVGMIASVIDLDGGTPLTTFASAGDYANAVITNIDVGHYRHLQPHVADALYSGTFTSFGNVASPWIDAASPAVQHYGVKVIATTTSVILTFNTVTRLWLEFRSVR